MLSSSANAGVQLEAAVFSSVQAMLPAGEGEDKVMNSKEYRLKVRQTGAILKNAKFVSVKNAIIAGVLDLEE